MSRVAIKEFMAAPIGYYLSRPCCVWCVVWTWLFIKNPQGGWPSGSYPLMSYVFVLFVSYATCSCVFFLTFLFVLCCSSASVRFGARLGVEGGVAWSVSSPSYESSAEIWSTSRMTARPVFSGCPRYSCRYSLPTLLARYSAQPRAADVACNGCCPRGGPT